MPKLNLVLLLFAGASCGVDRPGTCLADTACPSYQRCDATSGLCVSGCGGAVACGTGQVCGEHGLCVDAPIDASAFAVDAATVDASLPPDLTGPIDGAPLDLFRYTDMWICLGGCPEHGSNQDPAHASDESENATLSNLSICPAGDTDYFRIVPSHGGSLTATVATGPCGWDLAVDILASDGYTVVGDSISTPSGAMAQASASKNSTLFVRVSAVQKAGQNFYSLALANP